MTKQNNFEKFKEDLARYGLKIGVHYHQLAIYDVDDEMVGSINAYYPYSLKANIAWSDNIKPKDYKEILDLLVEYSSLPLSEREEQEEMRRLGQIEYAKRSANGFYDD